MSDLGPGSELEQFDIVALMDASKHTWSVTDLIPADVAARAATYAKNQVDEDKA